jgi:hypothetical protein
MPYYIGNHYIVRVGDKEEHFFLYPSSDIKYTKEVITRNGLVMPACTQYSVGTNKKGTVTMNPKFLKKFPSVAAAFVQQIQEAVS